MNEQVYVEVSVTYLRDSERAIEIEITEWTAKEKGLI